MRRYRRDDQDMEVLVGHEIGGVHLEGRRPGLGDVGAAEAHQRIGRALVDGEGEIVDRAGPVGAGGEDVADPLLVEEILVRADQALRGGGVVYTSDVDDLTRLQRHFPTVRILRV